MPSWITLGGTLYEAEALLCADMASGLVRYALAARGDPIGNPSAISISAHSTPSKSASIPPRASLPATHVGIVGPGNARNARASHRALVRRKFSRPSGRANVCGAGSGWAGQDRQHFASFGQSLSTSSAILVRECDRRARFCTDRRADRGIECGPANQARQSANRNFSRLGGKKPAIDGGEQHRGRFNLHRISRRGAKPAVAIPCLRNIGGISMLWGILRGAGVCPGDDSAGLPKRQPKAAPHRGEHCKPARARLRGSEALGLGAELSSAVVYVQTAPRSTEETRALI